MNDNGVVPENAGTAVKEARKHVHYVFLCTGRSKAELFDDIMEIGFDGKIAAAGGYIEVDDKVVLHSGLFASRNCKNNLRQIIFGDPDMTPDARSELEKGMDSFIDCLIEDENLFS